MPVLLTPDDVAQLLGLERDTVLAMSRRGELPEPVRVSRRTLRYRSSDICDRFGIDPTKIPTATASGATEQ